MTAEIHRPAGRHASRSALRVCAAGVLLLTACGAGPSSTPGGQASPPGVPLVPSVPAEAGDGTVATRRLPVYWVGAADGEQRLFREFRDAAERSAAVDPIAAAAGLMTSSAPADPDYRTLWSPAQELGIATSPEGTITVDLPAEAFRPGLDEEGARLALQQLVHTVTAAAGTAGLLPSAADAEVVVLVDGRPDAEVFGSVRLDEPLRPDRGLEAPVWLLDPQQGSRPEGVVTISGRVLAEVTGSRWTVTDRNGATARSGDVEPVAREDGSTEFRAELELDPGAYELAVVGRDGAGEVVRDDKDVEVVAR